MIGVVAVANRREAFAARREAMGFTQEGFAVRLGVELQRLNSQDLITACRADIGWSDAVSGSGALSRWWWADS